MPEDAVQAYEALRLTVIQGQPRGAGVAALRFHGMWEGLMMLTRPMATPVPAAVAAARPAVRLDDQFVRLLANLVLRTQTELTHVY